MSLSSPFIKRPIATSLLAFGLAIAGIVAFYLLPVSSLPQIEFPTISVQASLPGANPEDMATSVATPLERQLGRIAGITEMTSASSLGQTRITIQFDLTRDIDGAARDVQAAINAARTYLPTNLPSNPTYRKVNPADAPILIYALTSPTYTTGQMYDAASTILVQKLAQVTGVGQVTVGGSSLPAVRVELNPQTLNKYGIGLDAVAKVLAGANVNLAKGELNKKNTVSEIYTSDQLFKSYQYKPLIVAYHNGSPVRVSDVGEVVDSVENIRNAGLSNGKPAVLIVIFKSPGANIIEAVDNVRALIPQLKASIPAAIDMDVVMDRTTTIRSSLLDVEITLIIALILVILVVYVFLGSLRAMLIPGVAVVLSLLGTFGVMLLMGFSLDNLSLMALTISTGFVVDDAVVVLENITRHLEMGKKPMVAALDGAGEVGFTVLSMSLSLIAVFIPILLMGGIVGRLFREFAMTLSIAILMSLLVSLTVTPMMCAWFLKEAPKTDAQPQPSRYARFIHQIKSHYESSLGWVLDHPSIMLCATVASIVLTGYLFTVVHTGFFPQQDTGRIMGSIQAEQDISFQAMQQKLTDYIKIIGEDPAVENVVGFLGGGVTNSGQTFISLKALSERKVSADQVIARLRGKLLKVTGASMYLQSAQDLLIGGRQGNAQFQYTLSADNLADLNRWAPKVMATLMPLPGIADINSDQRDHGLQVYVEVDHDMAMRFGITPQQIDKTLYAAFGQSQVSTMFTNMNQYHVVMEVAPPYWQHPETLNDIYVASPSGSLVPLSVFAKFAPSSTLLSVNHQGLAPSATLSFNLTPNYPLGDAVNDVGQAVSDMHLPPSVHAAFRGTAQAFQDSLSNEVYLILVAILAVYIVLGILYESTVHPITILSTLPSAGVGALLALLITGTDLDIISLIGIILLIGIVKKNAIMMIDFALNVERTEQKSSRDSIYEAAVMRFRPIMMTTMAAMLGALPLAIGLGVGSELRRPLGIAIIGGLLVSQMLTLYSTPVIYLAFERIGNWFRQRVEKPGLSSS
ncbi:MAG: efflux RND transporter permease subunit [Gammaproteobacteria bacterium]|nr:efflux RND transporter permease subunit [Gammaproteobacteria bacterium]